MTFNVIELSAFSCSFLFLHFFLPSSIYDSLCDSISNMLVFSNLFLSQTCILLNNLEIILMSLVFF